MTSIYKVFTGNVNRPLAEAICNCLQIDLGKAEVGHFRGGETKVRIGENVRGEGVFIIQPICASPDYRLSPNDALMELLLMIDAAHRASAAEIKAVLPYFGYGRQDRKDKARVPISAKVVINLIKTAGATRILAMDLHSRQIQGFTDDPFDHLYSIPPFLDHLRQRKIPNLVIASPDIGGVKMARAYAAGLKVPLAVIDKRRDESGKSEVMNVIGEVRGCRVWFVDDIGSSANTLVKGAIALKDQGALSVSAICVHPVLAPAEDGLPSAVQVIAESVLDEVLVSDSIPLPLEMPTDKIKVISVAPLLAEAIRRIHNNESLSALFRDHEVEG